MVLGWGKPRIFIKELDKESAKWVEVPTPAEGSVQLTTTKGSKTEAKLEGGANEDVKYGSNTYALAYQIRVAKDKTMPFTNVDGIVPGNYALLLQPEDATTPSGIYMAKTVVSAEDTFTSADGGSITYTHDALKPDTGSQIEWGIVEITESGEGDSKVIESAKIGGSSI